MLLVEGAPLNVSAGAYWSVIRPDNAPRLSVIVQVALLLPR